MNRQELYLVFLLHGTPKKQNHHLTKPNTRTGFRIYIYIYILVNNQNKMEQKQNQTQQLKTRKVT